MNKDDLINLVKQYFNGMNSAIAKALGMLTQSPDEFSHTMAATVHDIFSILLATGYVLLVLFFMIDLSGKTVMLETGNYEVIVKLLLRFLLAKVIVENCESIMQSIFAAFNQVASRIGNQGGSPLGDSAEQAILTQIDGLHGGVFGINYVIYYITNMPNFLVIWVVSLITGVIVIGRMFEVMIYSAVAPLPLSTLAGESTTDSAKKFIQNYIAISLQGVIIVIAYKLFGGMMTDLYSGAMDITVYLMLVITFSLTIIKSGTWSKQIVGTM